MRLRVLLTDTDFEQALDGLLPRVLVICAALVLSRLVPTALRVVCHETARIHDISATVLRCELILIFVLPQRQRILTVDGAVDVKGEDEVKNERTGPEIPHNHTSALHANKCIDKATEDRSDNVR